MIGRSSRIALATHFLLNSCLIWTCNTGCPWNNVCNYLMDLGDEGTERLFHPFKPLNNLTTGNMPLIDMSGQSFVAALWELAWRKYAPKMSESELSEIYESEDLK